MLSTNGNLSEATYDELYGLFAKEMSEEDTRDYVNLSEYPRQKVLRAKTSTGQGYLLQREAENTCTVCRLFGRNLSRSELRGKINLRPLRRGQPIDLNGLFVSSGTVERLDFVV